MATADSSGLQRRLRSFSRSLGDLIRPNSMETAGNLIINEIEGYLLNSDYYGQVGFDPHKFIANLRRTMIVEERRVIIDPVLAGGDQSVLDEIMGQHLWHEGQHRSDAFFRFIYQRPGAREILAEERQAVWGSSTPQWFIVNYGALGVNPPQAPQLFMERGTDRNAIRRMLRAEIRRQLERDDIF